MSVRGYGMGAAMRGTGGGLAAQGMDEQADAMQGLAQSENEKAQRDAFNKQHKQNQKTGAVSGAASGAMMGASVGGPWGALIGGIIGGVGGYFSA